jgi:hypothetical protein
MEDRVKTPDMAYFDDVPKEFLIDVMLKLRDRDEDGGGLGRLGGCEYHEHVELEEMVDCAVRVVKDYRG